MGMSLQPSIRQHIKQQTRFVVLLLSMFFCMTTTVWAEEEEETVDAVSHTSDGNYLDFGPAGKVELPRLLIVKDASGQTSVQTYPNSHALVESGKYDVVLHGGKVVALESEEGKDFVAKHEYLHADIVPNAGSTLILDLSPTRHLIFLTLFCVLMCVLFISLANKYKKGIGRTSAPKGVVQNIFEVLILFVRDDIARPNLGKNADKYMPYLLSCFFIVLFSALLGLFPFSATPTANFTVTSVMAIFTFILTQIAGTKDYWKHIFWPPVPLLMKPLMIPIEILGMFTKPFALAMRLFANMSAGHLVLLTFISLIFMFTKKFGTGGGIGVLPLSMGMALFVEILELLVAFIQAYIFTMLSALYIGMAKEEHHEEHAH
jgi:F-type H+-transporting ATPase subunit a